MAGGRGLERRRVVQATAEGAGTAAGGGVAALPSLACRAPCLCRQLLEARRRRAGRVHSGRRRTAAAQNKGAAQAARDGMTSRGERRAAVPAAPGATGRGRRRPERGPAARACLRNDPRRARLCGRPPITQADEPPPPPTSPRCRDHCFFPLGAGCLGDNLSNAVLRQCAGLHLQ